MRSDFVTCVSRKVGNANPEHISTTSLPLEHHHAATWTMKILQSMKHSAVNWKPLCCHLTATLLICATQPLQCHLTANWMPLCCHSPIESPTYCHWIATELVNPSPLDYQSNATQSIKTLVKPILTQCISTQPICCKYCATQTTTGQPLYQFIANPVPLDCHCVVTQSIQCYSDYQWINHSTSPFPFQCHLTTTFQPISRGTTNGSTTKSVPFYFHSDNGLQLNCT